MHFLVSATLGGCHGGFCWPRKMGTNWFIPALVKRRLGASGRREDDGTMVCFFSRKKSRKLWRISAEVIGWSLAWMREFSSVVKSAEDPALFAFEAPARTSHDRETRVPSPELVAAI